MAKREKADGPFGPPTNLGEVINSKKDEMFPFVKSDSLLYFSSNGHLGLGGLDVFKATLNPDGNWTIENMKAPINSTADDFGIVSFREMRRGGTLPPAGWTKAKVEMRFTLLYSLRRGSI
jgi:peptidoglycan-associated lipoprotein